MYKSYFLNMTALSLSLVAVLMIGLAMQGGSPQIARQTQPAVVQIGNNAENIDYVLLLPPRQNISAARAPLPDIRYSEPADLVAPNYLEKGDSLVHLLKTAQLSDKEARLWSDAIAQVLDLRGLRAAHRVELHSAQNPNNPDNILQEVKIRLTPTSYVEARRKEDNVIFAEQRQIPSFKRQFLVSADINNSFYQAATDAGVPKRYLEQMIYYYSFDVDFQRDVKKDDSFEILYEMVMSENGEIIKYGDILSMSLSVDRQTGAKARELYLFKHANGDIGYYDRSGTSVEKALLKTPISGARLSSGFGYRRHPILGYNKLHKGVDFAAPTGTPIYAAGDGIVEYAGRFSAYGKYIRIRHGSKFKTAYAHLSRIADGVKKGARIEQRKIIGYVGSTGRSTGPHLHYEILEDGKAVNPSKLKLPAGNKLNESEIAEFREQYREIKRLMYSIRNGKQPLAQYQTLNQTPNEAPNEAPDENS